MLTSHGCKGELGVLVFNATLNNVSVISWGLVLLVEESGVPRGENIRPVKSLTNFRSSMILLIRSTCICCTNSGHNLKNKI